MRALALHGHFYQPPREDPWLDDVLLDPSAAPAHDWNERVAVECYRPNRAARLVDAEGRIVAIVDNYRHLSFNVGPTLHGWIERHDPVLDRHIKGADRQGGGAMAQAYNHMILPLASERDRLTQIRWGLADFRHRFGRPSEGFWLPETAVDEATLDDLALCGVSFVLLAPHQCAAVSPPRGPWTETPQGRGLDVTRPYRVDLPSGRSITAIFYHGPLAQALAFGDLLKNGDALAEALLEALPSGREEPSLLTVAVDGETFGHHHKFGEMALSRAFRLLYGSRGDTCVTTPAAFLAEHRVTWQARILPRSSWSCAHGLERWRSDCGCRTGGDPSWHQRWRGPLRQALDALKGAVDEAFSSLEPLVGDVWRFRDEAVALYLTGRHSPRESFLAQRLGDFDEVRRLSIRTLLEAQRMAMFMYTSCGWFFNDVAGIETAQIIAYALRACDLLHQATGRDVLPDLLRDLSKAEGNRPDLPDGAAVARSLLPRKRDLARIAAESALAEKEKVYYAFDLDKREQSLRSGEFRLRLATVTLRDRRTGKTWQGETACLSQGALDDVCRLREGPPSPSRELNRLFYEGDLLELSRRLEADYPLGPWRMADLPPDEGRALAFDRTRRAQERYAAQAEAVTDDSRRLLVQLHLMEAAPPAYLKASAELALEHRLASLIEGTRALDLLQEGSPLADLLEEAHALGCRPELALLAPRLAEELRQLIRRSRLKGDSEGFSLADRALTRARHLSIDMDVTRLQNETWRALETERNLLGDDLLRLADHLGFAVPRPYQTS
ncbi:DUF3536 domain-containing protein [Aminithiophilus ramosus]|uniref:DUF3536 domain-containing protein n=1 Tax=Aminithiophilus ramosus TaxID=3029084 RepID=A0A9Q7AGG9_9BACT|nr:DUF3536 domain-containing protein [Aminithiophilus ramosus]QTX31610.1 DUF3536 domain-containing protein [Aminithiophilus ramosus]